MPHDIFVSYAHSDDEPSGISRTGYGGITTFVEELKKLLRSKIGGSGADVWMDHQLAANDRVPETLREHVIGSRIILLFMSPGYLKSTWCAHELQQFLDANQTEFNRENVFVVATAETNRTRWPQRVQALTPTELYITEIGGETRSLGWPELPHDPASLYWKRMNELAHRICGHLDSIPPLVPSVTPPTVWIAQGTREVSVEWESLATAISQAGARVLPCGANVYPQTDATAFKRAATADLLEANLLVQLLGTEAGPLIGSGAGDQMALLQNRLAQAIKGDLHPKMLRWRNGPVAISSVAAMPAEALDDYQRLLLGAIDGRFEQFRSLVLAEVQRLLAPPINKANRSAIETELTLCITAAEPDKALAHEVHQVIKGLGAVPISVEPKPAAGQSIADYRTDFEDLLGNVDGVIFVYGQASSMWLHSRHAQVRKILGQRKGLIWGAFLDGPPPEKHDLIEFDSPGLLTLPCRNGIAVEPIMHFLQQLRIGGAHV